MSKNSRVIMSKYTVTCCSCGGITEAGGNVFKSGRKGKTKYWCILDAERLNYL